MVQNKSLAITLSRAYTNYEAALSSLCIQGLDVRRERLCLTFAQKCAKSHKHKYMFPLNPNPRFSAIPYLARLLNKENDKH